MNKCTMYLLVFMLITGPGLNKSVHAGLCDPAIAPCNTGSCMPCNMEKEQSKVDQNDCPNGCLEVTKVLIGPPPMGLCDPAIASCNTGSCMPCNMEKEQSKVDQNDCPNGCPEVTKVLIEPPPPPMEYFVIYIYSIIFK